MYSSCLRYGLRKGKGGVGGDRGGTRGGVESGGIDMSKGVAGTRGRGRERLEAAGSRGRDKG